MSKRQQPPTAVGEALTRAIADQGTELPARWTDEPTPGLERGSRRITDTTTGITFDVLTTCFGSVCRALSTFFPDAE